MKLKTYRAHTMADALSAVKKDLGKDAVILHTKTVKVGGLLGLGSKTMVEITAADEDVPAARRGQRPRAETVPAAAPVTRSAAVPQAPLISALNAYRKTGDITGKPVRVGAPDRAPDRPAPDRLPATQIYSTSSDIDMLVGRPGETAFSMDVPQRSAPQPRKPASSSSTQPAVMQVRERRVPGPAPAQSPPEAAASPAPIPAPIPAATPSVTSPPTIRPSWPEDRSGPSPLAIQRELADIKQLVTQVLQSQATAAPGSPGAGAMPEALFKHYLRLLESSVARDIADQVITSVRTELSPAQQQDDGIVHHTVLRHIADLIPVCDVNPAQRRAPGDPLVIALIGPTGVGKTTTIAKLAAAYKLRQGKSVALITSDTYRIAAVDQLRTYAGIIGLTLKVVLTPEEMAQSVDALRDHDVILIDTAGRSQFNTDRLAELREFLRAAAPNEIHLVLSSTVAEPVLLKTAEAFAPLNPNRVILTKLDEAVNFGVIVNVARRLNTQLSFVTMGQEVPDDIEPGQSDRLARLVLDSAPQASAAARSAPVGMAGSL